MRRPEGGIVLRSFFWLHGFSSRAAYAMMSHHIAKLHGPSGHPPARTMQAEEWQSCGRTSRLRLPAVIPRFISIRTPVENTLPAPPLDKMGVTRAAFIPYNPDPQIRLVCVQKWFRAYAIIEDQKDDRAPPDVCDPVRINLVCALLLTLEVQNTRAGTSCKKTTKSNSNHKQFRAHGQGQVEQSISTILNRHQHTGARSRSSKKTQQCATTTSKLTSAKNKAKRPETTE